MTLKVRLGGTGKRILTGLVTFNNGTKVKVNKGYTFVNGEKILLWGDSVTLMRINVGVSGDIIWLDDKNLLTNTRNGTYYSGGVAWYYNGTFDLYNISNPMSTTLVNSNQWGQNPLFSCGESSSNNLVFYAACGLNCNKVYFNPQNSSAYVNNVVALGNNDVEALQWTAPVTNHYIWGGAKLVSRSGGSYRQEVYHGYDNTTVNTGRTLSVKWDNGDFACYAIGTYITKYTTAGSSYVASNNAYGTSWLVDGNYILVGSKASNNLGVKLIKYNVNGAIEWQKQFDSSRQVDVIGQKGNFYYVMDRPVSASSQDMASYIRIYRASDGQESNVIKKEFTTTNGNILWDWKTFPIKTIGNYLWAWSVVDNQTYVCKIYV